MIQSVAIKSPILSSYYLFDLTFWDDFGDNINRTLQVLDFLENDYHHR